MGLSQGADSIIFPTTQRYERNMKRRNATAAKKILKPKSLRETVYERIRDDITFGKLYPGQRLTEATLADELKASRSPVREALRQLESEGLITFERNKGIAVSRLSHQQVDEIYNIRMVLEGYAVYLSVEKGLTEQDLKYLDQLNNALREAMARDDEQSWFRNNANFHTFFRVHSGNHNLAQLICMLERRVYRYKFMSVSFREQLKHYVEQHDQIINACTKRDAEQARGCMQAHLLYIKKTIMEYLRRLYIEL